ILWGVQTDLLAFAIPMALILEGQFYLRTRWALTQQDFYRTADLTSLGLVGLITFLFINRSDYHFITTLLQWLPIVFFPLVTILAYSTTHRMPLDVLFYSLRRQKAPVTQSWDMGYVFFGMCLLSGGTNTESTHYYIAICGLLIFISLFRLRSNRYKTNSFVLTACIVFLAGMLTQQTIRGTHVALKEQSRQWLANYIRNRANVMRTRSAMGTLGRLKSSDEIIFRVAPLTSSARPGLLQEASYNITSDNDWLILNPQFSPVAHADDFKWRFIEDNAPEITEQRLKIYLEFNRDTAIVPIPASVTEINDLPAAEIKKSVFGSIQATGLVPSPGYEVSYHPASNINSPPDGSDLLIPGSYHDALTSLIASEGRPDGDPLVTIYNVFRDFHYSLFQDVTPSEDPVIHFLTQSKAGHCEFFATATVMLLRHLGVPARYVVGYSVQEYNETLDMYVVRERHAHAWAIGHIDGEWRVVDTTPQTWAENEAAQSSFFRPVADMISNLSFVTTLWWSEQKLEDYE
ncbi:MAG: transglutaminase-like domain-containing protein, partial [Pseudomonadales bacterium]